MGPRQWGGDVGGRWSWDVRRIINLLWDWAPSICIRWPGRAGQCFISRGKEGGGRVLNATARAILAWGGEAQKCPQTRNSSVPPLAKCLCGKIWCLTSFCSRNAATFAATLQLVVFSQGQLAGVYWACERDRRAKYILANNRHLQQHVSPRTGGLTFISASARGLPGPSLENGDLPLSPALVTARTRHRHPNETRQMGNWAAA